MADTNDFLADMEISILNRSSTGRFMVVNMKRIWSNLYNL